MHYPQISTFYGKRAGVVSATFVSQRCAKSSLASRHSQPPRALGKDPRTQECTGAHQFRTQKTDTQHSGECVTARASHQSVTLIIKARASHSG